MGARGVEKGAGSGRNEVKGREKGSVDSARRDVEKPSSLSAFVGEKSERYGCIIPSLILFSLFSLSVSDAEVRERWVKR